MFTNVYNRLSMAVSERFLIQLPCLLVIFSILLSISIMAGQTHNAEIKSRHAKELLSEVYKTGIVRVIVSLDMGRDDSAGPRVIATAQEALLEELSLFGVEEIKRYRSIPMIVLNVGPAALGYLLASPAVSSVEPDSIAHTMESPES